MEYVMLYMSDSNIKCMIPFEILVNVTKAA